MCQHRIKCFVFHPWVLSQNKQKCSLHTCDWLAWWLSEGQKNSLGASPINMSTPTIHLQFTTKLLSVNSLLIITDSGLGYPDHDTIPTRDTGHSCGSIAGFLSHENSQTTGWNLVVYQTLPRIKISSKFIQRFDYFHYMTLAYWIVKRGRRIPSCDH